MSPLRRFAFSTVNFTIFISASALAVDSTHNAEFAAKEAKSDACYTWSWRGENPERRTRRNLTPLDKIEGFAPASDPETDKYGGWTGTNVGNSDGFFRVRKIDGRWWFVDPEGNLFLAKSVASFNPGRSRDEDRVRERLFGPRKEWAEREIAFVKSIGFNSLGAWASPEAMWLASNRIPYTMILSPMATYNHALDKAGKEQELFSRIDRKSGSSFGFPFVFDPGFEETAEKVLSKAAEHKDDPWLIGYFIDNEVQFRITMLEDCLTKWPEGHLNRDSAKAWLDRRKGRRDCTAADIDEADKKAFAAYCIDLYFSKVSRILRKYDKNHLFLGSRFHTWAAEMENPECFKVAGKYLDVVSLNHYRWDLDLKLAQMWERESGKPFMVTEFYAKGADSGLGNTSGAGFVVPTQEDRGLFYQHFAGRLLRSPACVGWTWFTYRDEPANDGNKGIVSWDFKRYEPLVRRMKEFNSCVFNLVKFLDGREGRFKEIGRLAVRRDAAAPKPCREIKFLPLDQGTMLYGDGVGLSREGRPYAKDPTVIRHDGRYLMYYSALVPDRNGKTCLGQASIAESTNLVDWTRIGKLEVSGWRGKYGWVAPCVKKIDGQIHLFAQAKQASTREPEMLSAIWHATSEDGVRFKFDDRDYLPAFVPTNSWCRHQAIDAEVYRAGDKMILMYASRAKPGWDVNKLGMAWAPCGSGLGPGCWTELTADKPFFQPERPWEMHCIEAPTVIKRNGIWYMFYAGAFNHERQQIGVAWSADGEHFMRWRDEPALPHGPEGAWNAWESGHPGAFEDDDGQVYLFYQGKATRRGAYALSVLKVEFVD